MGLCVSSPGSADAAAVLINIPLFAHLSPHDMNTLTRLFKMVFYRRGDVVIVEGEPGDALYIVCDGMVR